MSRRGLTLLETVLASVLLALAAAAVMMALGGVLGNQSRQLRRLEAAELANRLMIIYVDDRVELLEMNRVVDFGPYRYRWDVAESDVALEPAKVPEGERRSTGAERFKNVAIRVWLSSESGGDDALLDTTPQAHFTRMVDVIPKNPDSLSFMIGDERRRGDLIRRITENRAGGGAAAATPRGSTRPPSGPAPQPPRRTRGSS